MGAEESTMSPAQERRTTPVQTNGGVQPTATVARSTRGPKRIQQTLVPQAVLLVGYTPDGAPILMSNPSQNTVAALTSTNQSHIATTQPPIYETQTPIAPTLFSTADAPAPVPIAAATDQNYLATILQDQTPVMAVPKTILGPDGKPYTALVRPTSSADLGPQIIERGLISTGGSYQIIREPNGRLVRHIFHDKSGIATTTTGTSSQNTSYPPPYGTSQSSLASSGRSHVATSNPPSIANRTASLNRPTSNLKSTTAPLGSSTLASSQTPITSSNYRTTSTASVSQSPPHPTVQSTADFLRANSSLDTSYCPASNADSPRSSLIQYVSWDSDVAKTPALLATSDPPPRTAVEAPTTPLKTTNTDTISSPSNDSSTVASPSSGTETSGNGSHRPSKALKHHLTHGGDKGLIDVFNPYDEL